MSKYEEIEQLVLEYQSGKIVANKIVESFNGFFNKYLDIICEGNVNLSNKSIRKFIALFFTDKDAKKRVGQCFKSSYILIQASVSVNIIHNMFATFDRQEVENVLVSILLELASRYKKNSESPMFQSYLMSSFHFRVYHALIAYTKDPLFYSILDGRYVDEEKLLSYDDIDENIIEVRYHKLLTESDTLVDDNWIIGFTSNLFDDLSPVDRKILKLSYVDKYTDSEIADMFGSCRATINRRKSQSKKRLTKKLSELHLLK